MTISFRDHLRVLRQPAAPLISTRKIFKSVAVFGEIIGGPGHGLTEPMLYDDAYLVSVRLTEGRDARVFYDGKEEKRYDLRGGAMHIHDLRRRPQVEVWDAFHMLSAYLPRAFLVAYAEQHDLTFRDFPTGHQASAVDAIVESLLRSLQPALARPQEASALFVDHVAMALVAHLFATYGGPARLSSPRSLDYLSQQRLQRCLDLIEDSLDSDISLDALAQACNVSSRHLTRLFMRVMGQPPYRYLVGRRIARAKLLLRQHSPSLRDIAQICGFADQSHFTRSFTGMTGVSPAVFRREAA